MQKSPEFPPPVSEMLDLESGLRIGVNLPSVPSDINMSIAC